MRNPVIRHWHIRTGWHADECVEMPDGQTRAVWAVYDGPYFCGYVTKTPDGPERSTTEEDYREYCRRLSGR
jgi:hypothetical protein